MQAIIKAIFTGQDGSCGYKKDKEYNLKINHTNNGRGIIKITPEVVGAQACSYNSIIAFMRNWNNINNI